jgi:hypothetical protein
MTLTRFLISFFISRSRSDPTYQNILDTKKGINTNVISADKHNAMGQNMLGPKISADETYQSTKYICNQYIYIFRFNFFMDSVISCCW